IQARMAAKARPYVRLEIPLTPGGVELADLSRYRGISFDARGGGSFRLLVHNHGVRSRDAFAAEFSATGTWQTLRVPFETLRQRTPGEAWNSRDVRAVVFELSGPAGSAVWLDLDNVAMYR